MVQPKITSFFTSPKTPKPQADLIQEVEEVKVKEDKQSNHDSDTEEDIQIEEIENRRQKCNKSSTQKPPVPTVTIKDEDTCTLSDDEDEDVVQKPRSRAPKRIIEDDDESTVELIDEMVVQESTVKRKSTPKRKAPAKVQDGIIGMKVRSPANGRS